LQDKKMPDVEVVVNDKTNAVRGAGASFPPVHPRTPEKQSL
jgi:hypothetical protein